MHKYIAFTWNHQIIENVAAANALVRRLAPKLSSWRCVLEIPGLRIYHSGHRAGSSQAYLLKRNAGVVLGKVFNSITDLSRGSIDQHLREVVFNNEETQRIQRTSGKHLIERYWGRYVAILQDEDGIRTRVLRDPTGAMPCHVTKFHGITIVCSNIDDCANLGLVDSTISWDHIAAYLWFHRLVSEKTGLDNVRQVQAGECLTIDTSNTDSEFYWSPHSIHDVRRIENHQLATQELRAAVQQCVSAWASCYGKILHELSGGLDSSIVLACLVRTKSAKDIVCKNYYTKRTRGDERAFARAAAQHAGVELIERPLRASARTLESMLPTTRFASPAQSCLVLESQSADRQFVRPFGVEVVFSGQGGDHFFQSIRSPLIAADYARHHGLRPEILNVVADVSRFTKRPIWSILAAVMESGLLRRPKDPYSYRLEKTPPLVSDATCDALDLRSIRHAWVDGAVDLPGAKRQQVFEIVDSQNFHYMPSPCEDRVHPIISQPIIELCLQIPSYVLTYGGIDRALVRDAFAGAVPQEVLKRTVKGATTSFTSGLLVGSLPFLKEFLLSGLLVGEKVLDRKKTEAALTESQLTRDPHLLFPVVNAALAERWLRTWIGDDKRAVA